MSRGAWLGPAVVLLASTACLAQPAGPRGSEQPSPAPTASPAPSGPSAPSGSSVASAAPGSSGPQGPCADAPKALADRLAAALLVRGAYVSNLYGAPAPDLAEPPDGFDDPWWAAGRINGAGVGPEVGVWLWDRTADGGVGTVLSANASASRYFSFDAADPSLAFASQAVSTLVDCVGPMPEP